MKWFLLLLALFALLFIVGRIVVGRAAPLKPLGVVDGALAPCPDSPNCVSSFAPADDATHYIAPLAPTDKQTLIAIVEQMPRTTIVTAEDSYIHATQRSFAWGFIDDIEFMLSDTQTGVRSSSRTGYSDMGINRQRIEQIIVELAR